MEQVPLFRQRHLALAEGTALFALVPIVFPVQEAAPLSTSAATSRGSAEMSVDGGFRWAFSVSRRSSLIRESSFHESLGLF
jgi:hypothetical protein